MATPTVRAETRMPANLNRPAAARPPEPVADLEVGDEAAGDRQAVQTTAPMSKATAMPSSPARPGAEQENARQDDRDQGPPETGFVLTMAMALAATVVNRNDRRQTRTPMTASLRLRSRGNRGTGSPTWPGGRG
jgi:hypothetical protein